MAKNGIIKRRRIAVAWDEYRYLNPARVPVPVAPTGVTATPSGTTITIEWTDNNNGSTSTVVEYSPNGTTGWSTIATKAAGVTSHADTSLISGTYYYRLTATGGGMTSDPSSVVSASITGDGALLFSNGFETDLTGFSSPSGTAAYARVTNSPDTGTYCVRGNFIGNKYDSIANITGSGNTINLVVSSLRSLTPTACVVKYRFRIDPANYAAGAGGITYIKAGYFSDTSSTANTVNAFFPSINHQNGTFRFIGRNSTWLNATLSGWPASNVYFANSYGAAVNTFDGQYHTFEIRFNYATRTFRMFVDDLPIYGASYFTDGLFNMGTTYHFDQARIFYASFVDVSSSTDGSGIAGGWQLDNVEVYDGPA